MKYLIATILFLGIGYSSLAQKEIKLLNKAYSSFIKENDINWKLIQSSFDEALKKEGFSSSDKGKNYWEFFQYNSNRTMHIVQTKETDELWNEIDKFGSILPVLVDQEKFTVEKPWWYKVYRDTDESVKKLHFGKAKNTLDYIYSKQFTIPAPIGQMQVAGYLSAHFTAEDLNFPAIQKIAIVLFYNRALPNDNRKKAKTAMADVERRINNYFKENDIEWDQLKSEMDDYLVKNWSVQKKDGHYLKYQQFFEAFADDPDLTNRGYLENNFPALANRENYLAKMHSILSPIMRMYSENFETYHAMVNFWQIVDALKKEPSVSASILGGGLALSYSMDDARMSLHQKCFLSLLYSYLIKEEKQIIEEELVGPPAPPVPNSEDIDAVDMDIVEEPVITEEVISFVDDMPEFPGGEQAMMKYIGQNTKYPQKAMDAGIQGRVYVTFVVERDGQITGVKVLRGIGGGCDEEAVRVVKSMPRWEPGKDNGKPVRVKFNLPIIFRLT